jgi:tetratricopeptide (TPR) repeat protein
MVSETIEPGERDEWNPSVAWMGAVAVLVVCAVPSVAGAQAMKFDKEQAEETMEFGEEEAADQGGASDKAKKFLSEGKKLYKKGKYEQASLLLYRAIQEGGAKTGPVRSEATYQLARTLFHMNLHQGALTYFGQIASTGESHPYFVPSLKGLMSLAEVMPSEPTLQKHLSAYVGRFPDAVPKDQRDEYAYLTGRYFHEQLNVEQAVRMLKAVSRSSERWATSRYLLAITHVANYDAKPAAAAFKELLGYLLDRRQEGGLDEEGNKLLELAQLGLARVFYSTGSYDTSLKYYGRIQRNSTRWPQALFESSWAHFQVDQYNKALGNLHSLNSPFFADSYFPEGPILSAVIYFYNCKYDRVRDELDNFEYTYERLKEPMTSVLDEHQQATKMFNWHEKLRAGEVELSGRVLRIFRAAVDDREVRSTVQLVDLIRDEIDKIESMPSSWKSSSLGQSLLQEASLAESYAVDDAGSLIKQRLQRVVDDLNDLINQKKKILFEVARAEKGQIEDDIKAGMRVGENVEQGGKVKAASDEMYWEFSGEYWRDEIGQYVFNVGSRCAR